MMRLFFICRIHFPDSSLILKRFPLLPASIYRDESGSFFIVQHMKVPQQYHLFFCVGVLAAYVQAGNAYSCVELGVPSHARGGPA